MPRHLSSSISDAVLCAAATYCCLVMYRDIPKQLLTTSMQLSREAALAVDHADHDEGAGRLFPSLLTAALPSSLHLTSLSSLVVYGYFFLAIASAAGTLRFTGELPSLFVPLHKSLTHIATLLTVPSFVLAVFPLAHPSLTRTAASSLLSSHSASAAPSSLPVASFFTLSLSSLLLFPQLFRQLPRPIALATSASAVSAISTVLLLYAAALLTQSTAAGWWLLGGSLPLLLSSVWMAAAPDSSTPLLGGLVHVRAVDVFHYSFSATCLMWLHAFRLLFSQQPPIT